MATDPIAQSSPAPSRGGVAASLRRRARQLRDYLPEGQLLPEEVWRRRHRAIVIALWLHGIGLAGFSMSRGYEPLHALAEVAVVGMAATVAAWRDGGQRLRVAAASFGLITCSALLVHLSGGAIEAHFHFFVVIGVLTLYQDWLPFSLAIGYVVLHHGTLGMIAPEAVYNHPGAIANPWKWALIHAAFVLAASAANVAAWRTNERQLLRDSLTGLPSRLLFVNRLSVALARLPRAHGNVAVLFVDLDRFKVINDSLGHSAGDQLLVAVARRLRMVLREHETVARFGGDEFAILCEDVAGDQAAIAIAERVIAAFARPFTIEHGDVFTTASIGIALSLDRDQRGADLIRDADAAMYRAKDQGGGRHLFFDEAIRARAVARLQLEADLRRAVDGDELFVCFQPEVAVEDNAIVGVEALVRWNHPQRGLVAPGEFIPLAEETGLIVPIGQLVLERACHHARRWQERRPPGAPLSVRVNVSARQLAEAGLPHAVAAVLADTAMEPQLLCLEVTESVLMEDADRAAAALDALKALGVRIEVDDFGTGYSSLTYLRRFPVDGLKIDRSFVRGLGDGSEDGAIVTAIVEMARALRLSVTAEGVETHAQLSELHARGCDTAQGFLFARPETPEVVEALLAQATRAPGRPLDALAR